MRLDIFAVCKNMAGVIKKRVSLKKGDIQAFEDMFGSYYSRMMGYTCMMVNEEIARDIIQEVFLYIWEHRDRIDFSEKFGSYLLQMCYSRAIDYLRRKKTASDKLSQSQLALLTSEINWMKDNNEDITQLITNKEFMDRIETLVNTLPQSRKEVFMLSYFQGISNSEISEMLNMPQRTVESHLYLSLRFLREKFKNKGDAYM